jgi:hypothetical protein
MKSSPGSMGTHEVYCTMSATVQGSGRSLAGKSGSSVSIIDSVVAKNGKSARCHKEQTTAAPESATPRQCHLLTRLSDMLSSSQSS